MRLHKSGEDYLEAILVLEQKNGDVRSLDLAEHMGVSKPSISEICPRHSIGNSAASATADSGSTFPSKR